MASRRKAPGLPAGSVLGRAGNYAAPVDSIDLDSAMKATLLGTPMDKVEKAYVGNKGPDSSAMEAVRRARRANRKPPVRE